jgi:hypothetical protein
MRAVEYRIFVACRNATVCAALARACCTANNGSQPRTKISLADARRTPDDNPPACSYCIKNGERTATTMELSGAPVGMCLLTKLCVVACNNSCVQVQPPPPPPLPPPPPSPTTPPPLSCPHSITRVRSSSPSAGSPPPAYTCAAPCKRLPLFPSSAWPTCRAGRSWLQARRRSCACTTRARCCRSRSSRTTPPDWCFSSRLPLLSSATTTTPLARARLTLQQVFGRFGREDSTALITHKGGSLAIKVCAARPPCTSAPPFATLFATHGCAMRVPLPPSPLPAADHVAPIKPIEKRGCHGAAGGAGHAARHTEEEQALRGAGAPRLRPQTENEFRIFTRACGRVSARR